MSGAVLFDLDDTLYDVGQYYRGAFGEISSYITREHDLSGEDVFQMLVRLWREKTSMYPHLFNDLIAGLKLEPEELESLVRIFNGYSGRIEPYPEVVPTLKWLQGEKYKLGVITDGNMERQTRKLEMLSLEHHFDTIVYTQEIAPKPSPLPFTVALNRLGTRAEDAFYVANNPLIDFQGAREIGLHTVRILGGEFTGIPGDKNIDFEIKKMDELRQVLKVKV